LEIFRPRTRIFGALVHEARQAGGGMLAVGIHGQYVGEAMIDRLAQAIRHGRAFSPVAWQDEYT
jgi:hypothetical protein